MASRICRLVFTWASALAIVVLAGGLAGADEPSKAKGAAQEEKGAQAPAENGEKPAPEKEVDIYALPDEETVASLEKFIDGIESFRPTSRPQFMKHMRQAPEALHKAATKIVELEGEKKSPAVVRAKGILLMVRANQLNAPDPKLLEPLFADMLEYFEAHGLSPRQMGGAMNVLRMMEYSGNTELAAKSYERFAALLAKSESPPLKERAASMQGAARRLRLPGNEIEITGETIEGKAFDWAALRGKVVLIDFWATWCGPCLAELPNVQKNYRLYHEKGFEVVGISIDSDADALAEFLKAKEIPWVTLFEKGAAWNNANAQRYGIMGIPAVLLVNKEGKVVSLNARGPQLGKLLAAELGPIEEPAEEKKPDAAK